MQISRLTMRVLCLGIVVGITQFTNSHADTIFMDDFANPDPTDPKRDPIQWIADGASLSIADGNLQVESQFAQGLARAEATGVLLENVSVRAQARSTNGAPFVQLRFTRGAFDSGYYSYIAPDGTAGISISGGNFRDIAIIATEFRPLDEDVLMQLDAFGNELNLYLWRPGELFPSDPILSVTDDTITGPGTILLGVGLLTAEEVSGVFRFVHVADTPIPTIIGDFNGNGTLDSGDIDQLTSEAASAVNTAGYDLDGDLLVGEGDVSVWVRELFVSWIGDANMDKEFNSTDLIAVLASGNYEADVASVWSTGDFNGDGRSNSGDLVAALADGGYEVGPRQAAAAIPEPSTSLLAGIAFVMTLSARRRVEVFRDKV